MIINHNMNALNAHRNMNVNNTAAGSIPGAVFKLGRQLSDMA